MPERTDDLLGFIANSGWASASRELLAGDASNRSYDRLFIKEENRSAVLMNAPPDKGEDVCSFVQITEILRNYGFSAPKIFQQDPDRGFLLIEDLGDALFARLCDDYGVIEMELYAAAVDLLVELHQLRAPAELAIYDTAVYLREACLLIEWFLPAATGRKVPAELASQYKELIAIACESLSTARPVLVLRDFHAENLLWLPDRTGTARVGLLDYQDALAGHPAYDLVSLLEDARRDTSMNLRLAMKRRYLDATGCNAVSFDLAYNALGAQRNLKIIGIFTRLCLRDGKFTYLDFIPRVWDHLQRDLSHPNLAKLKSWVRRNVPEPTSETLRKIRDKIDAT